MRKIRHLLFLLALCLMSGASFGQAQSTLDIALQHLEANQAEWGLDKADLADLKISDHVYSTFGEVDHYYFVQRYEGIEVYNAITAVHVKQDGKVTALRHNFIPQLASKINTTSNRMNESDAVMQVLKDLEIPSAKFNPTPINRAEGVTTFDRGTLSNVDIKVRPIYQFVGDEVRLAWDVTLDPTKNADYWSIRVDAIDGAILDKTNFTLYCQFHKETGNGHSAACTDHNHDTPLVKTTTSTSESIDAVSMGGTYNVFAEIVDGFVSPFESPVHGDRTIITDPADPTASPFGWHDNNGDNEPDFDITRGNNVHAYLDVDDNNAPDPGSDVSGGSELNFDFPWSDAAGIGPEDFEEAAVSNLFFMNNYMHDFTYAYGFDERAGNFQQDQYGNAESGGNDWVRAEAQDGRDLHYADPVNNGNVNNANFATPADGAGPRMQMFIWSRAGGKLLSVNSPENIARKYETETAAFSPDPTVNPVVDAELALAFDDDLQNPSFVCGEITNPEEVTGKVAVIDRGGCLFIDKALNAQNAGAIAVLVCNFEDPAIVMGGVLPELTIPAIMIGNTDCTVIKSVMANSPDPVVVSIGADGAEGADFFDGDMDNGIVAHEYGHGISNRLVGGPSQAGCLANAEQMGEGWSDFFTLVTAQKPGQDGSERRGIGTYVGRESPNGNGIRSNPYSTDLSIRPETFENLPSAAVPHGLGAIWNSMLWDMYWALVDEHGFSSDLINGEAGNNIAVRLVMEGMKMTACSPGFVDGRDGILAADQFLYDGVNSCIIWEAFARRGLGENASQGSNADSSDGVADFNAPRECVIEMKLTKEIDAAEGDEGMADVVDPGESINMIMTIVNDKGAPVNEVTLTETIAPGTTVSNISNGGEVVGDNIVWELGTMEPLDAFEITYTLTTDPNVQSDTRFFDNLESGAPAWIPLSDAPSNPDLTENLWDLGSENAGLGTFSGNVAFFINDVGVESRENLLLTEEINVSGENPGLRFFHNFDTEAGADGVLVQVSVDGAITFQDIVAEQFIKNTYPRELQFGTFVLPFLEAYSGNSEGWIDTWVDLSQYQGQTIFVRFRFGSDDNTEGIGYAIDNFEYLNIERFNTTATLTTAEEDLIELILPEGGIKINSTGIVAVDDVNNPSLGFNIYPNPATETVNLSINNITAKDAQLSVFNYSGQLIEERKINLSAGFQTEQVNVTNYPTGFYFFRLTTERGVATEKIMVGK
jgi:hypothetical protein